VVVIPAVYDGLPVTDIDISGFASYADLTSIIIPGSVMRIGDNAFYNCANLVSIVIPAVTTRIGNLTFQGCSSLTTGFYGEANNVEWARITIGTDNTPLTDAARYYYSETDPDTTNVYWYFADDIPKLWMQNQGLGFWLIYDDYGNGTAYRVSKGTESAAVIVIPISYEGLPVTEIESYGFLGYTNLINVTIPNSVTSIGSWAFYNCSSLTSVTFATGSNISSFGSYAFPQGTESGGNSLQSVYLANGAGTYTRLTNGSYWTKQ
jgi:hypothetical protein